MWCLRWVCGGRWARCDAGVVLRCDVRSRFRVVPYVVDYTCDDD